MSVTASQIVVRDSNVQFCENEEKPSKKTKGSKEKEYCIKMMSKQKKNKMYLFMGSSLEETNDWYQTLLQVASDEPPEQREPQMSFGEQSSEKQSFSFSDDRVTPVGNDITTPSAPHESKWGGQDSPKRQEVDSKKDFPPVSTSGQEANGYRNSTTVRQHLGGDAEQIESSKSGTGHTSSGESSDSNHTEPRVSAHTDSNSSTETSTVSHVGSYAGSSSVEPNVATSGGVETEQPAINDCTDGTTQSNVGHSAFAKNDTSKPADTSPVMSKKRADISGSGTPSNNVTTTSSHQGSDEMPTGESETVTETSRNIVDSKSATVPDTKASVRPSDSTADHPQEQRVRTTESEDEHHGDQESSDSDETSNTRTESSFHGTSAQGEHNVVGPAAEEGLETATANLSTVTSPDSHTNKSRSTHEEGKKANVDCVNLRENRDDGKGNKLENTLASTPVNHWESKGNEGSELPTDDIRAVNGTSKSVAEVPAQVIVEEASNIPHSASKLNINESSAGSNDDCQTTTTMATSVAISSARSDSRTREELTGSVDRNSANYSDVKNFWNKRSSVGKSTPPRNYRLSSTKGTPRSDTGRSEGVSSNDAVGGGTLAATATETLHSASVFGESVNVSTMDTRTTCSSGAEQSWEPGKRHVDNAIVDTPVNTQTNRVNYDESPAMITTSAKNADANEAEYTGDSAANSPSLEHPESRAELVQDSALGGGQSLQYSEDEAKRSEDSTVDSQKFEPVNSEDQNLTSNLDSQSLELSESSAGRPVTSAAVSQSVEESGDTAEPAVTTVICGQSLEPSKNTAGSAISSTVVIPSFEQSENSVDNTVNSTITSEWLEHPESVKQEPPNRPLNQTQAGSTTDEQLSSGEVPKSGQHESSDGAVSWSACQTASETVTTATDVEDSKEPVPHEHTKTNSRSVSGSSEATSGGTSGNGDAANGEAGHEYTNSEKYETRSNSVNERDGDGESVCTSATMAAQECLEENAMFSIYRKMCESGTADSRERSWELPENDAIREQMRERVANFIWEKSVKGRGTTLEQRAAIQNRLPAFSAIVEQLLYNEASSSQKEYTNERTLEARLRRALKRYKRLQQAEQYSASSPANNIPSVVPSESRPESNDPSVSHQNSARVETHEDETFEDQGPTEGHRWGGKDQHPWIAKYPKLILQHYPAADDNSIHMKLVLSRRPSSAPDLPALNKWQQRKCAICGATQTTGLFGRAAVYCYYLELLVCASDFGDKKRIIPWRMVHKSDLRPYPVCHAAAQFLDSVWDIPVVVYSQVAPDAYRKQPRLQDLYECRRDLLNTKVKIMKELDASNETDNTVIERKRRAISEVSQLLNDCLKYPRFKNHSFDYFQPVPYMTDSEELLAMRDVPAAQDGRLSEICKSALSCMDAYLKRIRKGEY